MKVKEREREIESKILVKYTLLHTYIHTYVVPLNHGYKIIGTAPIFKCKR